MGGGIIVGGAISILTSHDERYDHLTEQEKSNIIDRAKELIDKKGFTPPEAEQRALDEHNSRIDSRYWVNRMNWAGDGRARSSIVKSDLSQDTKLNGWKFDRRATMLNKIQDRTIFKDKYRNYWSMDKLHGTWEKLNSRGKHLGEYDRKLNKIGNTDKSGKHNIKVK